jgi:hypothetical protein
MKPDKEYCAALATMILVTTVAIILIFKLIFELWN